MQVEGLWPFCRVQGWTMAISVHEKLRILFVSQQRFPPFRVDIVILFGRELAGRGHAIDWLFQSAETLERAYETEWCGGTAWIGPIDNGTSILRRIKKNFYGLRHDLKMFRLAKSGQYDFILVRDKFVSAVMALIASKLYKLKCIFWLSYPFPEYCLSQVSEGTAKYPFVYRMKGHVLRFLCYRIVMPGAAHSFVQTETMRMNIAHHGIPRETMTPVPMAVDIDGVPSFRPGRETENGRKSIVYLGTLCRNRRLDFLIRVFEQVLRQEERARLWLVGGGEDPQDDAVIAAAAGSLGVSDRMIVTGFLPQQEAWRIVLSASACVSPIPPIPILECGSPTKLIEYLALGKAAVANDHPEQSAVIAESGGGICVPYREEAFAEAILYLLRHPDEAQAMGQKGREYIAKNRTYKQTADLVEHKLLSLRNGQTS